MIRIGAYVRGSHPDTDFAIAMLDKLNEYLRQDTSDYSSVEAARTALQKLF